MELYFNGSESPVFVLDAVRFWAREYHVDGVHLVGYAPVEMIGADPYLSRLKLFAPSWENVPGGKEKHLAEYNEGFQNDICLLYTSISAVQSWRWGINRWRRPGLLG